MSGAVLEFQAVSKWYGQVSALTEVAFRVEPGVTGLVGQNGAGKSTLMKLACGLLRPSLGLVTIGVAERTSIPEGGGEGFFFVCVCVCHFTLLTSSIPTPLSPI